MEDFSENNRILLCGTAAGRPVYSHSSQDSMSLSNANEYVQGLYGTQYPVMASALLMPPSIKAYDESTWFLDRDIAAAGEYSYDSWGFGTYYDNVHGDIRMTNPLLYNNLLERNTIVDRIVATGSATVDLLDMVGAKNQNHKLDYTLNLSYSKTNCKDFTFVPSFIHCVIVLIHCPVSFSVSPSLISYGLT